MIKLRLPLIALFFLAPIWVSAQSAVVSGNSPKQPATTQIPQQKQQSSKHKSATIARTDKPESSGNKEDDDCDD